MPYVRTSDGVKLHFAVHDYTDPWREAPFLLLQHGFGRSGKFWYNFIPYLSRFYRVVCPDLRGLGQSKFDNGVGDLRLQRYIDDIQAIIDELGVERVHYAGESLGGVVGLAFAARRPGRIRTISVISTPLGFNAEAKKRAALGYASWADAILKLGSHGWAQATETKIRFAEGTDPKLLEWHLAETSKTDTAVLSAMAAELHEWDLVPELEKIEAPVLGMYPSSGGVATSEHQKLLTEKVKKIWLVKVPAQYHMIHALEPAVCAKHLLSFLALNDGVVCSD
jgi:3-oxoadipate enol-lactonase